MPDEILIDELDRVVAGYGICDIVDVSDPNSRVIARVDPDGPQDLCITQDDKCWTVTSSSATTQFNNIAYWESGEQVFTRTRTQNSTWPAELFTDPEEFAWRLDADGGGNLYYIKFNRNDGTFSSSNPDSVVSLQRTTTANSHATADIDLDSHAPSGPTGFSFYRSVFVIDVVVQESGVLAIVNWTFADAAVGGTTKKVSGLVAISSALSASTGVIADSAIIWDEGIYPLTRRFAPLPDGAIVQFSRSATAKTSNVSAAGSISSEVSGSIGNLADFRFDEDGNLWFRESPDYKVYSSSLADITPAWLTALDGSTQGFIVTSSGHRFAHITDDGIDGLHYRTYRCSDGTALLVRDLQNPVPDTDDFAVVALAGNDQNAPWPWLDLSGTVYGAWQQTPDARVVARSIYFNGPTGNWGSGVMKFSLDSILATVSVANTTVASNLRYQAFCCRGSYAHFSYAGW